MVQAVTGVMCPWAMFMGLMAITGSLDREAGNSLRNQPCRDLDLGILASRTVGELIAVV